MNITLKQRKIILLASIGVLTLILIVQQVLMHRSPVKLYAISVEPDTITVTTGDTATDIFCRDGIYTVGKKNYPATEYIAEPMFSALKEIRTIAKLTSSTSDSANERYGFTNNSQIKVEAKKDGRILRTVLIGKKASNGSQTYIRIDGSNDTMLASSNLKDIYGTPEGDIRSKEIYSIAGAEITAVEVKNAGKDFSVFKNSEGKWDGLKDAAEAKITSWADSISSLDAEKWAEDDASLPEGTKEYSVKISAGPRVITINFAPGEKEDDKWMAKCSESPYCFYITAQAAKKFLKDSKSLK